MLAPAREAMRPHTLQPISRMALLEQSIARRFDQESQVGGQRRVSLIIGDGGIGKSVMLGQLLDAFAGGDDRTGWPAGTFRGAVVLIACAAVRLGDRDADAAFGAAVDRQYDSLLDLLERLRVEYGSVTLLVDTLDLLLGPDTVAPLSDLLAGALASGEVVVTCRDQEFRSYLDQAHLSAPLLANRISVTTVPRLTNDEILQWTSTYLEGPGRSARAEDAAFAEKLRAGLSRRGSMWEVCSVPVRLALVCEVFSEKGDLPEDLTVTALYNQYWDRRVTQHAGVRSPAKVSAALAVAGRVLGDDGQLHLRVPPAELDADLDAGLQSLTSEGVLDALTSGWEFFHQTFAEFAVARWMLTRGIAGEPVVKLAAHLAAGQTNLWSIAGSLLLQTERDEDYFALVAQLPLNGPEAAKTHAVAALRRSTPDALSAVTARLTGHPDRWAAVLPELGSAPRNAGTAHDEILRALREDPTRLIGPATAASAAWLAREPADAAHALDNGLTTLQNVRPTISGVWDEYIAKLIRTQCGGVASETVLAVLTKHYESLGPLGRQATVRAWLDAHGPRSDETVTAFAQVALTQKCPPLASSEGADLLRLFERCQPIAAQRGWHDWRGLVADTLPRGGWSDAKVELLADLASADVALRGEVIDDLLTGDVVDQDIHINLVKLVAARLPDWLANKLLADSPPDDPRALGTVATACGAFARSLPHSRALELMQWLTSRRARSPLQVWPAQISLAGGSVGVQRALFDELMAAGEPQRVIESSIYRWLDVGTPAVLEELGTDMRALLQGKRVKILELRARLEAARAPDDVHSQEWIAQHVLAGESPKIAGVAVKTFTKVALAGGKPLDSAVTRWLFTLIATPHTDAATDVLELAVESRAVADDTFAAMAPEFLPIAIDRLEKAVSQNEGPDLIQALIECLVRLDRLSDVPPEAVRRIYENLAGRGKVTGIVLGSAVKHVVRFCGTLMARRLPRKDVRELLSEFLTEIIPGALANRTVHAIGSMLVGLQGRDAEALAWMYDLFGAVSLEVKFAIAEAFVVHDQRRQGGWASRLKGRTDCPPEVITYILNELYD
jgi:hypothetical protein